MVRDADWLDVIWWWKIRPDPDGRGLGRTNHFLYRSSNIFRPARRFAYEGALDALGRPHGVGRWSDTSPHGETLSGSWIEGVPVGPFRSTEHRSMYVPRERRGQPLNRRGQPLNRRG